MRVATVPPTAATSTSSDLLTSPLYLLAVLFAARRSSDRPLERLTRRRLESLGVHVQFGNELPAPTDPKGARRG